MMRQVKIIEAGEQSLHLCAALLLYRSNDRSVYATVHDTMAHPTFEGATAIGPGRPASKSALTEFALAVGEATAYQGMIPANLLYTAPNLIAWWTPACHRRVWFASQKAEIGNAAATIAHPPLVFVATAGSWYIYALAQNQRPDAKTKLFKAPYFNVWEQGKICTGNVDLPAALDASAIDAYQDAFFNSRFTHPNDSRLVKYKGGASALWCDQMQAPEQQLLTPSVLVSRRETLERAIQRIAKEENQ